MLAHCCLPFGLESLSLSNRLHDLEGHGVIQAIANHIQHDTVTRTDNLRNITDTGFDQILRIAKPYVGSVRQARMGGSNARA